MTIDDAPPDVRSDGDVAAFYDARVAGKLADFVRANPRVEAAIETIAAWSPRVPRRVLEVGCGIGATSWRMARAWSSAEVIGVDLSAASTEAARACFRRPNLAYRTGRLADCALDGVFDLVVMMDVYEHIAPRERGALQAELRRLLSEEARLVVTVPSPAHQAFLKTHQPEGLQPIDEIVDLGEIASLADATATRVLAYREVGVWRYGDYLHAVLGRGENLRPVARRNSGGPFQQLKAAAKAVLGHATDTPPAFHDHLGPDVATPRRGDPARRLRVSTRERRGGAAAKRLAASPRDETR